MLQDPVHVIARPLGRMTSKSQACCGLTRSASHPTNSPTAAKKSPAKKAEMIDQESMEVPPTKNGIWNNIARTGFACLRLARLHTLMAWAIFPAPAIYTIVLYHSAMTAVGLDAIEKIIGCMRISLVVFLCMMSYRAAGLAWDDLIDREVDAQVKRSMTRPLPAGDISVDGALLYILCQIGFTVILLQALTSPEVFLSFLVSGAFFGIYPYLKRWTNYTQVFGALLIAMGVIQGWLSCATLYDPIPGAAPGWSHAVAIMRRDWVQLLPIFMMEFFYELAHELIYGCQDTAEDVLLGLHSLSILCGYEHSRTLGTALITCFCCLLAVCTMSAEVIGWPLSLIPPLWLLHATTKIDLSTPTICGKWAVSAIKVKILVTLILMTSFVWKELDLLEIIRGRI